jgi:hypothetical protein
MPVSLSSIVPGVALISGAIDTGSLDAACAVLDFVVLATMVTSFYGWVKKAGQERVTGIGNHHQ